MMLRAAISSLGSDTQRAEENDHKASHAGANSTVTSLKERTMRYATRWLTHTGKTRAGAALFLMIMSTSTPATALERGTCSPTKMAFIVSETDRSTTSTTFVTLTETAVKFVQGGSRPSCVTARLEGYVAASGASTVLSVSATIDGNTIDPGQVQLAFNQTVYLPSAWTFIIPSVAPGAHRIVFKFRSNNGNAVTFNSSNAIIHHAP
jgi:hypothetical protein